MMAAERPPPAMCSLIIALLLAALVLAAGLTDRVRWGIASWLSLTTYDTIRNISSRTRDIDNQITGSQVTSTAIRSSVWHGRLACGFQWDITPRIRFGINGRSPGIALLNEARVSYDLFENTAERNQ